MRQVVLDTETTGLEVSQGHRIIEIGCVELLNRKLTGRHFHRYINPNRAVDEGALAVHGISNSFLADKPVFAQVVDDFMAFVDGAELIIHNAAFDIGFINYELQLHGRKYAPINETSKVIDSLALARSKHPGQKNNLDALCKRYFIDNSHRELHGALLDAEILATVYLAMTGGQTALQLGSSSETTQDASRQNTGIRRLPAGRQGLPVIKASATELESHHAFLEMLDKKSGNKCVWLQADAADKVS